MQPIDKLFSKLCATHCFFRKGQALTQTQLADILSISQQTMVHYDVGRLRISVALLTVLAKTLAVGVEELIETPARKTEVCQ